MLLRTDNLSFLAVLLYNSNNDLRLLSNFFHVYNTDSLLLFLKYYSNTRSTVYTFTLYFVAA